MANYRRPVSAQEIIQRGITADALSGIFGRIRHLINDQLGELESLRKVISSESVDPEDILRAASCLKRNPQLMSLTDHPAEATEALKRDDLAIGIE